MSEHTPGPWQIESRFVGPLVITAECSPEIDMSGKIEIAHVGAETFTVANANARLIAAAPDMLAALAAAASADQAEVDYIEISRRSFLEGWDADPDRYSRVKSAAHRAQELRTKAIVLHRAAIAKAKGEA